MPSLLCSLCFCSLKFMLFQFWALRVDVETRQKKETRKFEQTNTKHTFFFFSFLPTPVSSLAPSQFLLPNSRIAFYCDTCASLAVSLHSTGMEYELKSRDFNIFFYAFSNRKWWKLILREGICGLHNVECRLTGAWWRWWMNGKSDNISMGLSRKQLHFYILLFT